MRVAVDCQSPLLQKSIENFLTKYISTIKNCDIVVRDIKCLNDERCFYISTDTDADLLKPFSKSQLILALENKYKELKPNAREENRIETEYRELDESMDFDILERRIDALTDEYKKNIINAVKAFYEK